MTIEVQSIKDGLYYRANVLKIIKEDRYYIQCIDVGFEESVHISDIMSLSTRIKEVNYFYLD